MDRETKMFLTQIPHKIVIKVKQEVYVTLVLITRGRWY